MVDVGADANDSLKGLGAVDGNGLGMKRSGRHKDRGDRADQAQVECGAKAP